MGEKIAMGFHTCVDYELAWDTAVVEEQIRAYGIRSGELEVKTEADSERMYDKISQAEKKIADFILNHIDDAVNSNVSELANHSGVSDATVIRFCKHLGYDGYYQMRLCLSRDIGRSQISSDGRLPAGADSHGLFRMIADTAVAAAATIDNETLKTVVNLILNCDTVHLVAAGNTTSLCMTPSSTRATSSWARAPSTTARGRRPPPQRAPASTTPRSR